MTSVNDMAKCLDDAWLKRAYGYKPQHVFFNDKTFIGRYENLHDDLLVIAERIGVPLTIGHTNKSKNRDFREQYTDEGRELVLNHYREDVVRYGY